MRANLNEKPAEHIHGLDILRTFAVALVFIWHFKISGQSELWSYISAAGWTGVDLFFILSGYLIGGQLFSTVARGEKPSLLGFYFKRSMRILPAFWVVLALYFCVPGFSVEAAV